jgi:hypothetical protein
MARLQLVGQVLGQRTAVRPGEQALLLQQREVPPQGRLGHPEPGGQLTDVHRPTVGEGGQDLRHPF